MYLLSMIELVTVLASQVLEIGIPMDCTLLMSDLQAPSTLPHEVRISIWETLEYLQGGNMTVLVSHSSLLTSVSLVL